MSVKNSCSVFFAFSRNIFFFPFFISFFHFYFTSQALRFSLRFSLFFSYEFFSFSFFNSGKVTVDEIPSRFQAQFPCIHIRLIQMHLSIYITTVADNVSSRMSRSAQVLVENGGHTRGNTRRNLVKESRLLHEIVIFIQFNFL